MDLIAHVLQVIVAFGLLNVWLLRGHKKTAYRGGQAQTLQEEFAIYGLPTWFYRLVGALKISSAILLIVGLFVPGLVLPAVFLILFLMLGAIGMHLRVQDPWMKSLPALGILLMSLIILSLSL